MIDGVLDSSCIQGCRVANLAYLYVDFGGGVSFAEGLRTPLLDGVPWSTRYLI